MTLAIWKYSTRRIRPQVVYYLQELDGEGDIFSVSTVNGRGVIRLIGQLDYERSALHQLRILAIDRANDEKVFRLYFFRTIFDMI